VSRHHVDQRWSTFTRKRRAELEPQLPLPCVAQRCIRGGVVFPDPPQPAGMRRRPTSWHVGHIRDAAKGGQPTRENTGPIHAACNLAEGGRAGAAITNGQRADDAGIRPW
jgi:hypothetical protein